MLSFFKVLSCFVIVLTCVTANLSAQIIGGPPEDTYYYINGTTISKNSGTTEYIKNITINSAKGKANADIQDIISNLDQGEELVWSNVHLDSIWLLNMPMLGWGWEARCTYTVKIKSKGSYTISNVESLTQAEYWEIVESSRPNQVYPEYLLGMFHQSWHEYTLPDLIDEGDFEGSYQFMPVVQNGQGDYFQEYIITIYNNNTNNSQHDSEGTLGPPSPN